MNHWAACLSSFLDGCVAIQSKDLLQKRPIQKVVELIDGGLCANLNSVSSFFREGGGAKNFGWATHAREKFHFRIKPVLHIVQ